MSGVDGMVGVVLIIIVVIIVAAIIIQSLNGQSTGNTGIYEPVNTFTTLMPVEALAEIRSGRLPRLNSDTVILTSGEYCHYVDKAYLLNERVLKKYHSHTSSVSYPSLLSVLFDAGQYSVRYRRGEAHTQIEEIPITDRYKGLLYITNRRIIFVGKKSPFDKPYKTLSAKIAYSDGIEFQFGSKYISLLVPDGRTASTVVDLVLARRST